MNSRFLIFPRLNGDQIILRQLHVDDLPHLIRQANNKAVSDNIVNIPHPFDEPQAVFRLRHVNQGFKTDSHYVFAIIQFDTDKLIGEIALTFTKDKKAAELGYWLGEDHWNHGYMTEAVKLIVDFGFERMKVHKVIASCYEDNLGSWKVLTNNGFVKTFQTGRIIQFGLLRES